MTKDIVALVDDATSRSSSPYLFLDSSSSHSSDAATASFSSSESLSIGRTSSTPHIFLAYSKPIQSQLCHTLLKKPVFSFHTMESAEQSVVSSPDLIDLPLYTQTNPKRKHAQYHDNDVTKSFSTDQSQSTQAGQETCEGRPHSSSSSNNNIKLDWNDLSHTFEQQCSLYMTEQHLLPKGRATTVAFVMSTAMAESAHLCYHVSPSSLPQSKNDCLTKYAAMVDTIFMPPDLHSTKKESGNLATNCLRQSCCQQEEELWFLRTALKQMILLQTDTGNVPGPQPVTEKPLDNPIYFPDVRPNFDDGEIPTSIEFSRHSTILDPLHLEDHSELTPSVGDFPLESPPPLQPTLLLSNIAKCRFSATDNSAERDLCVPRAGEGRNSWTAHS